MASKEEKKRRQGLVRATEAKHQAEEISKMPILKADLKALLEYLDRLEPFSCDHSLKETVEFLASRNLDESKIAPWLNDYGGYCDCEVLANVGSAWGKYAGVDWVDDDAQEKTPKKNEQKEGTLSLACGLKLASIPKEWKLFLVDEGERTYRCLKYGKKGSFRLAMIETLLPEGDHETDTYWIQQWTELTRLPVKDSWAIERGEALLANAALKSVTVMNSGWIPVYRWLYKADNMSWYMQAETTLERKQGDFRELTVLLKKMELA
jgi:hypothetical protein